MLLRHILRASLILLLLGTSVACSSAEHKAAAAALEDAITSLEKLDSDREVGLNLVDYTDSLRDANFKIKQVEKYASTMPEDSDYQRASNQLQLAFHSYNFARLLWSLPLALDEQIRYEKCEIFSVAGMFAGADDGGSAWVWDGMTSNDEDTFASLNMIMISTDAGKRQSSMRITDALRIIWNEGARKTAETRSRLEKWK